MRSRSPVALTITFAVIVAAGCSHAADVRATYPLGPPGGAGSIAVALNQPTQALSITIDGQLVVERAATRHAQIDGVPAGTAVVETASGGRCEHAMTSEHEVDVVPGRVTTVVLPGPEPTTACQIASGLSYVGAQVGLVALALLLVL